MLRPRDTSSGGGLLRPRAVAPEPEADAAAPATGVATPEDPERERRRAAAAGESVALAAAGMSTGPDDAPEESAVPATTILAVEEGDETPPLPRDPEQEVPHPEAGDEGADPDEEPIEPANPEPTDAFEPHPAAASALAPDAATAPEAEPLDAAVETEPAEAQDEDGAHPVRLVARPLGQAPLLDSDPLPATRPGMLRPRATEEPAPDHFSLPTQRPAFELGDSSSGEPVDIA
jgi:arginase